MREIYRNDIYWVDLGQNENSIQSGLRPCIVVSNNTGNHFARTITVCPLTTKLHKKLPTHSTIAGVRDKESLVLCEQMTIISKTQVHDYIRTARDFEIEQMNKCIKIAIGLED